MPFLFIMIEDHIPIHNYAYRGRYKGYDYLVSSVLDEVKTFLIEDANEIERLLEQWVSPVNISAPARSYLDPKGMRNFGSDAGIYPVEVVNNVWGYKLQ